MVKISLTFKSIKSKAMIKLMEVIFLADTNLYRDLFIRPNLSSIVSMWVPQGSQVGLHEANCGTAVGEHFRPSI